MYVQDDWRVTDRLTVNAGLRYDLVTGFDIDQSGIPNYNILTGRGGGRSLQRRAGLRGVRQRRGRGRQQHPAAHRRGLRPPRRRQGRHPRRLGHLLRLRLHQRHDPRSRASAPRAARARSSASPADGRHPECRTARSSPLASRSRNIASQNEVNPNGPFYSTQLTPPEHPPALDEPDLGRLVAPADAVDGLRRRLRPHQGHATSACAGRSTRASTAAPAATSDLTAEPGEPDVEHERRREQVRRRQLRRPPPAEQGHLAATPGTRCRRRRASAARASTS